MSDAAYRKCVLHSASFHDLAKLHASDLLFTEGIISACGEIFVAGERTDKRFPVALRSASKFRVPKRDLLLNVRSRKESDDNSQGYSGKLKIFLLDRVLQKYELRDGEMVWVKPVKPFPLERVVITISSEEKYLWSRKFFATFLLNSLSSGPFIVRENEVFYLPDDQEKSVISQKGELLVKVLQCEPVQQGCVTQNTSVVITKSSMPEVWALENKATSVDSSDDLLDNFLLSDFTLRHGETLSNELCSDSLKIIAHKLLVGSLMESEGNCSWNRIFVSLSTLVDLKLFNGSWVKIDINKPQGYANYQVKKDCPRQEGACLDGSLSVNNHRVVQLIAVNSKNTLEKNHFAGHHLPFISLTNGNEIKDGVGYISPLLSFNLFGKINISNETRHAIYISPIHDTTNTGKDSSHDTMSKTWQPAFATEVHIALVQSPHYKAGDSFDGALAEYFKVTSLLTVGDIFFVTWNWQRNNDTMNLSSTSDERCRNIVVYFQVTKLVCAQNDVTSCFVDVEHSSLYQRGSVHSYVPIALEQYCVDRESRLMDSRRSFWDQSSPPGLNPYVDALENIVKPYLDSSKDNFLSSCGILLSGPHGTGKRTVTMATSRRLNLHTMSVSCFALIGESIAATETRIKNGFERAVSCSPCILLLLNIETLGKDKEGNDGEPRIASTLLDCISSLKDASDWPVVVIATTSSPNDVTAEIFSCFVHELKLEAPNESERRGMLFSLAAMASVGSDVSFEKLAKRTAGLVLADFVALFSYASGAATKRLKSQVTETPRFVDETGNPSSFSGDLEEQLGVFGVQLCMQDFDDSLEILQSSLSDAIGAPKIPSVKWEDVGGLLEVKAEILDTVQLPLKHPELFAEGLRRSGVLLYGPPGTGKTLLAKAVATECSLNFLSVKGPELINMYVGQSEQNIREVFTRAQSARPCVIFFDELDSLAPNRGRSGDSGGVMDRVVSQLLAELDGLHKACDVFVIGATNRPDLLDPALLRPGRFDKLLYLGVSGDQQSQLHILRALTRKFNLAPDLQLENVAALCPPNLTGADFYALCSDAMLNAVKRKIEFFERGLDIETEEIHVVEEDFRKAFHAIVPSVSVQELKRYKDLQKQFAVANSMNSKK